jgi:ribosomal protein S18 acetylase RimI-like enzyme
LTLPVTLRSASELGHDELAELFNRAYADYEIPLHADAGTIAFMEEAFDLVPARSRVAYRGDEAVGVALLGVRNTRGWVGGMGVTPAARRRGVGEQLMRALIEQARLAGVTRLALEVLEHNAGARALYEKLGFRNQRRLELHLWDCAPRAHPLTAQACAPRSARQRIAAARREREPWQRDDDTLDRLDVSSPALRAVTTPGGDAIYRVIEGRASVLQLHATSETSAGVLLDTLRARAGVNAVRYLNVPEQDLAVPALRARGSVCSGAQFEMVLEL